MTDPSEWMSTKIRAYLRDAVSATAREMASDMQVNFGALRARLGEMKKRGHVHISGWQRDEDGGRLYPRALWTLGPGRDARKPPPLGKSEYRRRHFRKKAVVVTSVFALGTRIANRRLTSKRVGDAA